MKNICILALILTFFSCQKTELLFPEEQVSLEQEINSTLPEEFQLSNETTLDTEQKNLFTTYTILQNTTLLSHDWPSTENFQNYFFGEWKTIEVITVDFFNQIVHLDYTTSDIRYTFSDDCRVMGYNQFTCRYNSSNENDPSGVYEVSSHLGSEYLYILPDDVPPGQPDNLKERPWGEILLWPGRKDIMIVYLDHPDFPYWLFLQKQING